jgi:hypothetical protein
MTEETSVFTTLEPLRPHLRWRSPNANLVPSSSRLLVTSMGLFDPRRFDGMRSLTPLSRLPLTLHAHELSPVLDSLIPRVAPYVFGVRAWDGRVRRPPRPPSPTGRETRRLEMIRGAFYRQGPFVGSGGRYSPGPATTAPLLAMLQPLDDALTSPWDSTRARAVVSGAIRDAIRLFESTRLPTCDRRHSPRPRPPFTRP